MAPTWRPRLRSRPVPCAVRQPSFHKPIPGRTCARTTSTAPCAKKVGRELRKQLTIDGPTTVLVAISGGKDSAVLLSMLVDLIGNRPDVRIVAGCVDEGIEGYRPPSIEAAAQLCEMLDVEFITTSFAEQDFLAMDEVTASLDAILDKHPEAPRLPCSYCGVFRRQGINALADMVEADVVALGHNLDDMAQTVLMNLTPAKWSEVGALRRTPSDRLRDWRRGSFHCGSFLSRRSTWCRCTEGSPFTTRSVPTQRGHFDGGCGTWWPPSKRTGPARVMASFAPSMPFVP